MQTQTPLTRNGNILKKLRDRPEGSKESRNSFKSGNVKRKLKNKKMRLPQSNSPFFLYQNDCFHTLFLHLLIVMQVIDHFLMAILTFS